MDSHEVSAALTEIDRRTQQTLHQGSPRRVPAWYTCGSAAALTLVWASTDVSGLASGVMAVAGTVATVALTRVLERVTGVRLRMRALRWAPLAILTAAMVVTAIGVGTLMRFLDVPVAGTIGGLAAALVWIAGMGPAQAAAGITRRPSAPGNGLAGEGQGVAEVDPA